MTESEELGLPKIKHGHKNGQKDKLQPFLIKKNVYFKGDPACVNITCLNGTRAIVSVKWKDGSIELRNVSDLRANTQICTTSLDAWGNYDLQVSRMDD